MSRASELSAKVFSQRVNESVFNIGGHLGMGDGGATASTKNIEDHLRAKGYVAGREFRWLSPYMLQIQDSAVDRDLLDSIQNAGGVEDIEHQQHDIDMVGEYPHYGE